MAEERLRGRPAPFGDGYDVKTLEKRLAQGLVGDDELSQLAGLKTGQIGEFRELFRMFDSNGDGMIDQDELRRMMQSLHFDSLIFSDEFYQELIRKVKGPDVNLESDNLQFSFSELMFSMLRRPDVNYDKADVLKAFSILAGKSSSGMITEEKLSRALYRGDGGMDPTVAEEIMNMLEHNTGGVLDYQELVDLMMGTKEKPLPLVAAAKLTKKVQRLHGLQK